MRVIQRLGFALVLACVLLAASGYAYFDHWRSQPLGLAESVIVQMLPGDSLLDVVAQVSQPVAQTSIHARLRAGVQRRLWLLLAKVENAAHRLQVGEYQIDPGQSPAGLLQQLQSGAVVQHEFRIAEGSTVNQLLQRLNAETRLQHRLKATNQAQLATELDLSTPFSEGQFFPDTYLFARGSTDIEILQRAHQAMQQHLQASWQQRNSANVLETPIDALVLASIIEKESSLSGDRSTISQVFHNRLRKRMRLQTDPTVIYGLGTAFDGDLTRKHLRDDTPFNTYTRHGLPPTPIALPSQMSLLAATQPSTGDFLYFVARGDGTSQFSITLEEHNKAVRRYQLHGRG